MTRCFIAGRFICIVAIILFFITDCTRYYIEESSETKMHLPQTISLECEWQFLPEAKKENPDPLLP